MPSLLDLPREIRDIISAYALTNYSPLSIPNIFPHYHHGGSATIALSRSHLALTQTNRQLRAETRILFYAVNTFTICLQPVNVKYQRLKQDMRGRNEWQKIFRRSYGNLTMAEWFDELPDEAIGQLRGFTVYFACVLRWRGDEVAMEREKCRAYQVADIPGMVTTRMTKHILYDMCSGPQLFYEIDLDNGSIESFVEVVRARREGGESEWGGIECNVCLGALQKWLNSVSVVDGKKRLDRAALERLVWPSNLEPTTEPKKVVDPPDRRI